MAKKRIFSNAAKRRVSILLSEEQTILSRERTMHSYMQTGLAFVGVGLLVTRYVEGVVFTVAGIGLSLFGAYLLLEAATRFRKYRRWVRRLRKIEKQIRLDVGE